MQPVLHQQFLNNATALSRTLPNAPYLINLCQDRYRFALVFAAALIRGVVNLFPPNRLAATVHEIARDYPGAICVGDQLLESLALPICLVEEPGTLAPDVPLMPHISSEQTAFLAFTSGSTGCPRPHPKRWGDLVGCALMAENRFGIDRQFSIVATVPPQHMYGLETSIMLPLVTGARVVSGCPLFPVDIRSALECATAPRVLVTTPVHLAGCVEADFDWPALDMVISAAAPLTRALAEQVESRLATRVFEIYGSTETGSIASRRTCRDPSWTWYDSVRTARQADRCSVTADFLPTAVPLSDLLEFDADGRFRLLGRAEEMIKVGGKRASLADLNLKLNAIEGVRDGVFVAPDEVEDPVGRLAVIAVAPGLNRRSMIAALEGRIDPVFYPRQIVFVDALPRNEAGKLPRKSLLRLLDARADQCD